MTDPDSDPADLGPKPDAVIEPGETNPGGVDALPDEDDDLVPADLPVELNPAVDETATPGLSGGEDTSTRATTSEDGSDTEPDSEETPA